MEDTETPAAPRPVAAIVGRPNVGKSTLFNRMVGKKIALVEDLPGVTRDRNYADTEWDGRAFTVVDTGGFLPETEDRLLQQVRDQARLAIEEAQVVVFVVDGMAGLTAADQEVAGMLRKAGKPVLLVVNKLDSSQREEGEFLTDFYRLGIEHTFSISAEHGRGMGDFLDALVQTFPPAQLPDEERDREVCRVAIIGRPNAGKSTMVNKLLGEERFVASEVPGTTRDAIDTKMTFKGRQYVLTDTAGIRRKSNISSKVEQFSVMRALKAIENSDVVILLLDATELAVEQDARLGAVALEKGKAIVTVVNKWDLIEKKPKVAEEFKNELLIHLPFLAFAPTIFASALKGDHVFKALETAGDLFEQYKARIPTPLINQFIHKIEDEHPAPLVDGHPVRLFYMAQIGERPPTFSIASNKPEGITDDYKRFIINRMRSAFGLQVPIRLILRRKSKKQFVPKKEFGKGRHKGAPRMKANPKKKPLKKR